MKFQVTLDTANVGEKVKDKVTNTRDKVKRTRRERRAIALAKSTIKNQTEDQLLSVGLKMLADQEAAEQAEAAAKAAANANTATA